METLANLESFVRSAEVGSFSEAARRLRLTPAAVSRNVAMLERNLGTRLFHRSTRKLSLTEAGEWLLIGIGDRLDGLQAALAESSAIQKEPSGQLKVSMSLAFGLGYIVPLLPDFMARYPEVRPDWHFDSRRVDLVAEGYDAAIGGGFELSQGIVARALAPAHIVAVAAPSLIAGMALPRQPSELNGLDGIVMRSANSGRIRHWMMRDAGGAEMPALLSETIIMSDPAAMVQAALMGLGVALLAVPDVLPHLESGALVRLCPKWWADAGSISLYYSSRALLPAKTRAFVDFVADHFRREQLAERFAGSLG